MVNQNRAEVVRMSVFSTEIHGTKGVMYLGRHGGSWQVFGNDEEVIAQDYGIFPDDQHQKILSPVSGDWKSPTGMSCRDT
ncbi:MAG: hypothetical protein U9R49_12930 [Bacteroidota bacterium]|nr:hypothetical protein [Bacteroidota bacterium]